MTNKGNKLRNSEIINDLIYDIFNLSKDEREYIDSLLKGY